MTTCDPAHDCTNCPSRQTTEWRDLTGSELALVTEAKRTRSYDAGAILYDQGADCEGVYCIQSGMIGLRRLDEDGNSALVRLCRGGMTVGYRAFLSKRPHLNSAEVLTPSVVCFIARSYVSRLLVANPQIGQRFLQHAMQDLEQTEAEYARILTSDLRSRFMHMLMIFYEQIGYEDEAGRPALDLPLKRSELAELLGIRPESISRLIKSVSTEGLLDFDDRRVHIRNMDEVLRIAGATM